MAWLHSLCESIWEAGVLLQRRFQAFMMMQTSQTNRDFVDDLVVWCTNIDEIDTSDMTEDNSEWKFYLNKMTTTMETKKILSFLFTDDQKRSLVSILIQRAMIRNHLRIPDDIGYSIERTSEVAQCFCYPLIMSFINLTYTIHYMVEHF
jgi:hypothetical protein